MVDELGSRRDLFDVPDEVAYFNAASLSPVLRSVREAGESALRRRARPWAIGEADWFADVERLRSGTTNSAGSTSCESRRSSARFPGTGRSW